MEIEKRRMLVHFHGTFFLHLTKIAFFWNMSSVDLILEKGELMTDKPKIEFKRLHLHFLRLLFFLLLMLKRITSWQYLFWELKIFMWLILDSHISGPTRATRGTRIVPTRPLIKGR